MKRIALEAYDDGTELSNFTGLDALNAKFNSVQETQVAIESAFNQAIRLQQLKSALGRTKGAVAPVARKAVAVVLEDAQKQTGIQADCRFAAETSVLWKNSALESISSVFNAIIAAIRKAIEWVWNAIKQLFGFANSSRKQAADTMALDQAIDTCKKAAKGPAIKQDDMPFIDDAELLKKLDTGEGRVINVRTLHQNIVNIEQFFSLIKLLSNTSRLCSAGLLENFYTFKIAVDQASKVENSSAATNNVDFLMYKQNFYNTFHSTVDQAITENALPASIPKEQNLLAGVIEKSPNKSNTNGSLIDFKSEISQFKQAPVLGGWKKLFFVLYKGEYENYNAYSIDEEILSSMSEGSSRYLLPGDLLSVTESVKKLLGKKSDDMVEIERNFQTTKTIVQELLTDIAAMDARNFDKTFDEHSKISFSETKTQLLMLLKKQQQFFSVVFFNSVKQACISADALPRYITLNERTFNLQSISES